jgi:glycosyltransferase involved in cell wall biosynthesis
MQGHTLHVIRTESPDLLHEPVHAFGDGPLWSWKQSDAVSTLLLAADAVIHQIGDNYLFHQGSVEWLPSSPGLICLHDGFVGHLFLSWLQHHRAVAADVQGYWYGAEAPRWPTSTTDLLSTLDATVEAMPMTEWICSQADAVLTHSRFGLPRILASCPGPVSVAGLAMPSRVSPCQRSSRQSEHDAIVLVTLGYINPNKQVDQMIRALGSDATLLQRVHYRLVGPISPSLAEEYKILASSLNVTLSILGEVDDATFSAELGAADIVSCLRWPCLEAASASAIEAMRFAKPVIVTDAGFYAELPSDSVIKTPPCMDHAVIADLLRQLVLNQSLRQKIGSKAERYSSRTFTEEKYVSELVALIERMLISQPILSTARRMASTLSKWSPRYASTFQHGLPGLEIFAQPQRRL